MSVRLYVEGGGDRNSKIACRRGFQSFVRKAGAEGRMPKIIASGSRNEAYDDFNAAHAQRNETAMLLVDSEQEVTASSSWAHLRSRDNWRRPPDASSDQCHLIVQVMEFWFLVDHQVIKEFYGHRFRSRALSELQTLNRSQSKMPSTVSNGHSLPFCTQDSKDSRRRSFSAVPVKRRDGARNCAGAGLTGWTEFSKLLPRLVVRSAVSPFRQMS